MDRVADFESVGWGFESLALHQIKRHTFWCGFFVCTNPRDSNPKGAKRLENHRGWFLA